MADEKEDEVMESGLSDEQYLREIAERDAAVKVLIGKRDKVGALIKALQSPPVKAKGVAVKDANAAVIIQVISAFSDSELATAIEKLDIESCDVLMKYVYRFMAKSTNCTTMLKLHALISEKAGMASIIKTITDRKVV